MSNDPVMEQVMEFQKKFKLDHHDHPKIDNMQLNLMRIHLLQEELGELSLALVNRDLQGTFDALCDLEYVLAGAWISLGLHRAKLAGVAEVHRSNMSKLDAQGNPVLSEGGRVIKSELYSPPDLRKVLEEVFS